MWKEQLDLRLFVTFCSKSESCNTVTRNNTHFFDSQEFKLSCFQVASCLQLSWLTCSFLHVFNVFIALVLYVLPLLGVALSEQCLSYCFHYYHKAILFVLSRRRNCENCRLQSYIWPYPRNKSVMTKCILSCWFILCASQEQNRKKDSHL